MSFTSELTSGTSCGALGAYDGPRKIVFDVIFLLISFLQSVFPPYTWVPALQQYLWGKERDKNNLTNKYTKVEEHANQREKYMSGYVLLLCVHRSLTSMTRVSFVGPVDMRLSGLL